MIRLFPLLLLVGCGFFDSTPKPEKPQETPEERAKRVEKAAARAARAAPPPPKERLVQGTVRGKGEGMEIIPCHGGAATPFLDDSKVVLPLLKEIGDPLYIEAGVLKGADGAYNLKHLHRALNGEGDRCKAIEWTWAASGTEPFWSFQDQGDHGTIHQPDPPPHTELVLTEPQVDGGVTTITGSSKEGAPFSARFEPKPCRDAMSGAWYSHTVTLDLGGSKRTGCGAPGEPEL